MKEVLIVKHAVGGRTFIHSEIASTPYTVIGAKEVGWTITVDLTPEVDIQEIIRWKDELNVFLFQDFEDQPTVKVWFYVNEGPVSYDEKLQKLSIQAQSRIDYVPTEFGI